MNQDAQRIAIAEWMGYREVKERPHPLDSNIQVLSGYQGLKDYFMAIPNYPLDLNAMHDAENRLTNQSQKEDYQSQLWKLDPNSKKARSLWNQDEYARSIWNCLTFATSQQRSEALCRTLFCERFNENF